MERLLKFRMHILKTSGPLICSYQKIQHTLNKNFSMKRNIQVAKLGQKNRIIVNIT